LRRGLSSPEKISKRFGLDSAATCEVCNAYPARINEYYLSLIKETGDPLYLQSVPTHLELEDNVCTEDPLHEEPEHQKRSGVPNLITHRYPDRVLFLVSNQCSMFCRFCTRKRKVGEVNRNPTRREIEKALEYIANHEEVRDVVISGGDPLMLSDEQLEIIISSVYSIISKRQNGIIRIGTRMPCALPQRVTPELVNMLRKYHPIYINTHFNHPNEITEESKRACNLMANAGIPLGNQTVLLSGVNDNPETLKDLFLGLLAMRVKPYYIYQADPVKGTNHFRTRVEKTLELYHQLRGQITGMAVPSFVIDAPGGGGKVRLPGDIVSINDKEVIVRNYEGKLFSYPQL